jgi:hypothetical protein
MYFKAMNGATLKYVVMLTLTDTSETKHESKSNYDKKINE